MKKIPAGKTRHASCFPGPDTKSLLPSALPALAAHLIPRIRQLRPPGESQYSSRRVPPVRLFAFTAWPGEGCEEANFGLCQFPAEVIDPRHGKLKTGLDGWRWSSFCKTQYASDPQCGGVTNFLRCHLTVIALLDQAKQLGCLGEVNDELAKLIQRVIQKP